MMHNTSIGRGGASREIAVFTRDGRVNDMVDTPVLDKVAQETDVQFLLHRLKRYHPLQYRHSRAVAVLFEQSWDMASLSAEEKEKTVRSALLHDIGFIHITHECDEALERHPELGVELLTHLGMDYKVDRNMIVYHHENLDGTGYPFGMDETSLSIHTRMLRIISFFDEFTEGSYTTSRVQTALEELYRWSGVIFDEELVESFHHSISLIEEDIYGTDYNSRRL
jgi:HD-GYP domain-containing protein (c-di-GMP phosphodiesterase class II)